MTINPASLEALKDEATGIDAFLNTIVKTEIEAIVSRGNDLSVFVARTGQMLADAKLHQDNAVQSNTLLCMQLYKSLPPTTRNKLISSMCANENYMVNWIERLNRTATHQLNYVITLISKAKAELIYLNH